MQKRVRKGRELGGRCELESREPRPRERRNRERRARSLGGAQVTAEYCQHAKDCRADDRESDHRFEEREARAVRVLHSMNAARRQTMDRL